MAPPPLSSLFFFIAAVALLFSPAHSQNCTSQTFNTTYENCQELPSLRAFLHWTYNRTARPNPTLTIAFPAPPARPEGWVAWALNPTGTGMAGSQALVAFRDANGSTVVKTYNISSYGPITESRISYNVISRRAEHSDGVFTLFASLELPPSEESTVNQVWQVGPSVRNGVPERHAFSSENLNAKSILQLEGGNSNGPAAAPMSPKGNSPAASPMGPGGRPSNGAGGRSRFWGSGNMGLYGVLVLLGVWIV